MNSHFLLDFSGFKKGAVFVEHIETFFFKIIEISDIVNDDEEVQFSRCSFIFFQHFIHKICIGRHWKGYSVLQPDINFENCLNRK